MKLLRQFLSTSLLLCGCVLFTACPDKDDNDDYVKVSQSQVSFEGDGGSITVSIQSNTAWMISGVPRWLTVSPSQGSGDAIVSISATASTTSRSQTLTITAGDAVTYIYVSQGQGSEPGPNPIKPYIGAWMIEEDEDKYNNRYYVCYKIINEDGTGVYQEFYVKTDSGEIIEDEYATFRWTASSDNKTLYVIYDSYDEEETWDISGVRGDEWRDDDIAYRQSGYTPNPSVIGTWKWSYYDESLELVFKDSRVGTFKYWDNYKLDEDYSFTYYKNSSSIVLTNRSGDQTVLSIAFESFNRLVVLPNNWKGYIVLKKQE